MVVYLIVSSVPAFRHACCARSTCATAAACSGRMPTCAAAVPGESGPEAPCATAAGAALAEASGASAVPDGDGVRQAMRLMSSGGSAEGSRWAKGCCEPDRVKKMTA